MTSRPRRLRRIAEAWLPQPGAAKLPMLGTDMKFPAGAGRRFTRRARAVRRFLLVFLWTLVSLPTQAACLLLPGRAKVVFARLYWAVFARLLGVRVRVIGQSAGNGAAPHRRVVYASNHSSWLDIAVLGGRLDACFIAKAEIAGWPLVATIARLGRTVFITRQRGATGRERDAMRARLAEGDDLILFPEGTTSDGSRVLPFRSAFFGIVEPQPGQPAPLIQPVSVVYDRLAGLPTGRASRPLFAWYGDMDIASHSWRLAQHRGLRATVLLHTPLDPAAFADRKALSAAVWRAVADGAATLRQNRPARPIDIAAAPAEPAAEAPAFA
ncbi:MAG: 1-acyl-sn-glycerol-3-phosphate acyltransferase [Proteobacteria bacterium]|nr:1-acyl-sn-glycerol-3-phosphate acyltransferase [Pseudomonadota bacterium]